MKQITILLLIIVTSFSIYGCNKSAEIPSEFDERIDKIRYFADYRINAKYEVEGRYEFNPDSVTRAYYYQFGYDSLGQLVSVRAYGHGKFGYGHSWFENDEIRIEYEHDYEYRRYYDKWGDHATGPEYAYGIRIKLDYDSNSGEILHLNHDDSPIRAGGKIKQIVSLDDHGRIIESIGLRILADSVVKENISEIIRYAYDENAFLSMIRVMDGEGNLLHKSNTNGLTYFVNDSRGNHIEKFYSNIDFNFQSAYESDSVGIMKFLYNEWGQCTLKEYVVPIDVSNIPAFSYKVSNFDSTGNHLATCFLDENKNLIENTMGYAIDSSVYSPKQNKSETIYLNAQREIASPHFYDKQIASKITYLYDEYGRVKEEWHYNSKGDLFLGYSDFAICEHTYDDKNFVYSLKAYDVDEKPINAWTFMEDCAIWRIKTDALKKIYDISYFDVSGKLVGELDSTEISIYRSLYDNRGNLIEESSWRTEKELAAFKRGPSVRKYTYDKNDYKIEQAYYDEKGRLVNGTFGAAREVYERNEYGVIQRTLYYRSDGSLMTVDSIITDKEKPLYDN